MIIFRNVKCIAYQSLVYPILEYSSPVWNPYPIKDIQALTKEGWVFSDYSWSSSVSIILNHLGRPTLAKRCLFARLYIYILPASQMPSYYSTTTNCLSHRYHPLHSLFLPKEQIITWTVSTQEKFECHFMASLET